MFSLQELEDLFTDIQNIINYVEQHEIYNRFNVLFLSNGERIRYNVTKECIPHLLGIQVSYLQTLSLTSSKNSFEMLKRLVENPLDIYNKKNNGIINFNKLFSKYTREKVAAFGDNIKIDIFSTEFICKYRSDRTYMFTDKIQKCDYIIVKKYQDGRIGVIQLFKQNNKYVPASSRIYDNLEAAEGDLEELIRNQEVTIVNGSSYSNLEYYDEPKRFTLNVPQKRKKLDELFRYRELFDFIIETSQELSFALKKAEESHNTNFGESEIITTIINAIETNTIIKQYPQDSRFTKIIEAINNFIFNSSTNDGNMSYSTLMHNLREAREETRILRSENYNLEKKNAELEKDVVSLRQTNENYVKKIGEIANIIKSDN